MKDTFDKKLREICTYYSELGEGTAGYCLSEEQFKKVKALFSTMAEEIIGQDEDKHYAGTFFNPLPGINFPNVERNKLRVEMRQKLKEIVGKEE